MFQNILRPQDWEKSDPFQELNNNNFKQLDIAENPFFSTKQNENPISVETHFVSPHYVNSYSKQDGTFVEGYWRDGDGNTDVDLDIQDGGGYIQTNPDDTLANNLG
ncbi:hypothetical protein ACFFHF_09940 [Robertmurraya beringensis]|uniref:Uncharacterized protein n=1 Tax=Robertmurraya beringensis TaxID=641660 RepID=A0ABV6KQH4_9BACI